MTTPDDSTDDMGDLMLDETTADLLLGGLLAPEDVQPEYADVVGLVRALSLPPTAAELSMQAVAVEASLTELALRPAPRGSKGPVTALGRKWSTRSRFFRTKVASLVVVGALIGTTGLAAAGALPAPLQDAASKVLAKVGISVPTSDGHPASSGEEISNIATTTDATGVDKGAEISTAASGGQSKAGQNGKASHLTHPAQDGTNGKSDEPHADKNSHGNAYATDAGDEPSASGQEHGKPQSTDSST